MSHFETAGHEKWISDDTLEQLTFIGTQLFTSQKLAIFGFSVAASLKAISKINSFSFCSHNFRNVPGLTVFNFSFGTKFLVLRKRRQEKSPNVEKS